MSLAWHSENEASILSPLGNPSRATRGKY